MTFRRAVLFILVFALLLGCAALPAGAEHTHHWVDGPNIQQPTCTEPGWKTQYCDCGQSRDVQLPALGHEFSQQVYTGYADCTHYGSFYWVCQRCGAHSAIGNDKPLGHDWDEGVITKAPQGFTPGEKLYTCKRDPSHTYTEEVKPTSWLFATLEGDFVFQGFADGSIELRDIPPLVIVKQPEGGYVDEESDEGLVMTVEVSGGEPPYTYEWHMADRMLESISDDTLAAISGGASIDASDWSSMVGSMFGGMLPEWMIDSMPQVDVSSEVVGDDSPELHACRGNCEYWCKITDSRKQSIESDKVAVDYKIYITEQPRNVNLTGVETAVLTCKAAGGRAENGYTYTWYDQDGTEMGTGPEFAWDLEGEYYCVASDGVDTAVSDSAVLYIADRLKIRYASAGGDLYWPEDEGKLMAIVSGGVPPYEATWTGNPFTIEGAAVGKYTVFTGVSSATGDYTFTVTDSMEARAEKTVTRRDRQLTITRQPEGGLIPAGENLPLSVELEEAQLPVYFELFQNGQHFTDATSYSLSCTFEVDEPGIYYYRVKDDFGHRATSDSVVLVGEEFTIEEQTSEAKLKSPADTAELMVKVKGGTSPYTYEWRRKFFGWVKLDDGDQSSKTVDSIGTYICHVTDDKGRSVWSQPIKVTYAGEEPLIIVQPSSIVLEPDQNGFTLNCKAISGTGDDSGIIYAWYYWQKSNLISGLGEWKLMGVETQGRVTDYREGLYRCVVTDMATGKNTCSEVALVAEKLQCTKMEVKREYTPVDPNGKYWGVDMSFSGGTGPYTIQIFSIYYRYSKQRTDVLYSETVVDDIRNYHRMLPMYHEFVDTSEYQAVISAEEAQYFMIVKDAGGQILYKSILMD